MARKQQPTPPKGLVARIAAAYSALAGRQDAGIKANTVGGYTGASYRDQFAFWSPPISDANTALVPNLRDLRARSRDLVRNSPIAAGAIETSVAHVVGSGLTLQSHVDADFLGLDEDAAEEWQRNTERLWCMWADSELCDAFGQQTFSEVQDLAFRSHMESGDSFVVLAGLKRPNWPFQLALQVVEADRVSNEDWKADSDQYVQGIERDANQQPVAIWICDRHPGAAYTLKTFKWSRVAIRGDSGRRNVLHLFRKLRPGQTRGVPALAPIIETLKQLTRYSTAEVDAAVTSAAAAVFVKMDAEAFQDIYDDQAQQSYVSNAQGWDGSLKSGQAVNLLPGEDVNSPTPGRPNVNFDPFVQAVLRQIGMALDIPHEVLTKHFQASYSAARAALLDAWRTFRIRRQWLAGKLCQPVYEEWLADAVANGLISAPGFFNDPQVRRAWCGAMWGGDGPGALDPLKEAQAAELRVKMGLTTLPEEIVAYDGGDWEEKHRVASMVTKERIEDGLQPPNAPDPGTPGMPGSAPAGKPGAAPPAEPGESNDGENEDDSASAARRLIQSRARRHAAH